MFSSTMRTAVFQATAIFIFSSMLNHHLTRNMFDQVLENEGFLNFTRAMNRSVPLTSTDSTPGRMTLGTGNNTNRTSSLNHTTGFNNETAVNSTLTAIANSPESFYRRVLPRETIVFIVISVLQYWWLIGLERILPARSRHKYVLHQREEKVEESEDREEEVVKKWIAQGRVRRASLNWCNTFLKWLLDLTVGRVWYHTVEHVVTMLLRFHSPKMVLRGLTGHLTFSLIGTYLSIIPLANLIAFIIIPAHKRLVFIAGTELVATIFFNTLVRVFAIWAVKTDFAQRMMRNITDSAGIHRANMAKFRRYNNEL